MWNFDVDIECRAAGAAIHFDMDVVVIDRDVLGDRAHDLLPQNGEEVALAARRPVIGQERLQPLPRDGRGRTISELADHAHAALPPSSLSSSPLRSLGIVIGTSVPPSRRAASK